MNAMEKQAVCMTSMQNVRLGDSSVEKEVNFANVAKRNLPKMSRQATGLARCFEIVLCF